MEKEERLLSILNYLIEGVAETDLLMKICEEWELSRAKARHIIQKAKNMIRELVDIDENYELGKIIARMEYVYRLAYEKGDYRTCLSVLKSMTDIMKTAITKDSSGDPLVDIVDLIEEVE